MSLPKSQLRWIVLSLIIIFADLYSKYLATENLSYATSVKITSFFNLTLLYNYGAAFSFLSNENTLWQVVLLSSIAIVVSLVIIIWLAKLSKTRNSTACSLALILGGAIGNLSDRLYNGYVVDFLDFHINQHHWPAFNIADTAICTGAIIMIIINTFAPKT